MLIEEVIAQQKKTALLFLDMEFTNIHDEHNGAWEIGYILDVDGTIIAQENCYLRHSGNPSDWVLKNTLYKKVFKDGMSATTSMNEVLLQLQETLSKINLEEYDIVVIGASVEGDFKYLTEQTKRHNIILPLHWRVLDVSNIFLGYMWAKGEQLNAPIAVIKMLRILGLKSTGKRHTVNTDNEDLRNIYYVLKGNAF